MLRLALLVEASRSAVIAPAPSTIDLLAKPDCSPADSDVVVCGRRLHQRLPWLTSPRAPIGPSDGPPSVRLSSGGSRRLHAVTTELPRGEGSGAATTLIVPF